MALTDNLISYWKLDESSGNSADSVGSNTLTNNNSTAYVSGKINNGADFESTSSNYFSKTSSVNLPSGNSARSVSAWIKIESYPDHMTLLSYGTRSNYQNFEFSILSSGVMTIGIYNENSSNSSTTLSTGTWYHIAMTYDGTTVKFYLNGVLDGSDTFTNTPNTGSGTNLYVGILNDVTNYKFDGIIDELGIWSRALTEVEVGQLYNLTSGIQYPFTPEPSTLVAQIRGYWKLDESSGNAADSYGSNTLTNTNTATYGTGKINNSVLTNPTGTKYLVKTNPTNLPSGASDHTISFWAYPRVTQSSSIPAAIAFGAEANNQMAGLGFSDVGMYYLGYSNDANVTYSYATGTWSLYTVTVVASTKKVNFYVNGSLIGTEQTLTNTPNIGTGFLNIGAQRPGNLIVFDGNIDEVGVWARALTSTEITNLYNSGSGKAYPFPTIQNLTMLADTVAFILTGNDTLFTKAKTLIAAVGNFILTGYDAILTWTGTHWTNQSKNTSTFTNQTKNTSIWSNLIKH